MNADLRLPKGDIKLALPNDITIYLNRGSTQLALSSSYTSTVRDLKALVRQYDRRHPIDPILSFPGTSALQDHRTLQESGIGHKTVVKMTMHFQLYIVNNNSLKISVKISPYARVSSLKLVVSAKLKIPVPNFWFACSGEILVDCQLLGHYPQIIPGSEIVVGLRIGARKCISLTLRLDLKTIQPTVSRTRVSNSYKSCSQALVPWNPDLSPSDSTDLQSL